MYFLLLHIIMISVRYKTLFTSIEYLTLIDRSTATQFGRSQVLNEYMAMANVSTMTFSFNNI